MTILQRKEYCCDDFLMGLDSGVIVDINNETFRTVNKGKYKDKPDGYYLTDTDCYVLIRGLDKLKHCPWCGKELDNKV